jgi:hypothetical protein
LTSDGRVEIGIRTVPASSFGGQQVAEAVLQFSKERAVVASRSIALVDEYTTPNVCGVGAAYSMQKLNRPDQEPGAGQHRL